MLVRRGGTLCFSLASGCGSGGNTDVNLKAGNMISTQHFLSPGNTEGCRGLERQGEIKYLLYLDMAYNISSPEP